MIDERAVAEPIYPAPVRQSVMYLSGPISSNLSGYRLIFAKYAEKFRAKGFVVVSPAELDIAEDPHQTKKRPYRYYMERDIRAILDNDVNIMAMLPGWQESRGARFERNLAEVLNVTIIDAETEAIIP